MSRPSERREEQRAGERIDRRVNDGPEAGAERAEREPSGHRHGRVHRERCYRAPLARGSWKGKALLASLTGSFGRVLDILLRA